MAMNIHHLELFYYVARHGGISAAVRHMPYGIQQPAVSSQILQLEADLGVKLFQRQPFRLTPAGTRLFGFAQPFFSNLKATASRLRQRAALQLRLGAPENILRDHLPTVLQRVRQEYPELRLALRSGLQLQLEGWVRDREIDLAVLPLARRLTRPLRFHLLLRLPLVLLVPRSSRYKRAAELWARGRPAERLIGLPESDAISLLFQQGLKRHRVVWSEEIEASSLGLVTQYVANGDGVGANIGVPELSRHPQVRALPLDDAFKQMELGAVWNGEPSPMVRAVVAEMQRYALQTWPDWANPEKLK